MLAVGKPMVLPISSPWVTFPDIEYSLPSILSAEARSPSVRAFLISVLLTLRLPSMKLPVPMASKPYSSPIFLRSLRFPARPFPKQKSSPTTTHLTPSFPTSISLMKASAPIEESSFPNLSEMSLSMPSSCMMVSLSRSVEMRGGAFLIPLKYSRGCGSKVMTAEGTWYFTAISRSFARTMRCPSCTPSKFPMVRTQPECFSLTLMSPRTSSIREPPCLP